MQGRRAAGEHGCKGAVVRGRQGCGAQGRRIAGIEGYRGCRRADSGGLRVAGCRVQGCKVQRPGRNDMRYITEPWSVGCARSGCRGQGAEARNVRVRGVECGLWNVRCSEVNVQQMHNLCRGLASSAWHIDQMGPPYRWDVWAWAQSSVQ